MRNPNEITNNRRSIRLQGYDYRKADVYFVTLCTYLNSSLFGTISAGEMLLSELGKIVEKEWLRIATIRSNVRLDLYVVMPNHLHGVIFIEDCQDSEAPQCMYNPKRKDSRTLKANSLGAIVSHYKAAVSRRAWSGLIGRSQRIWQRNYYDHIVRDEASLNEIRKYIVENPARWHDDSLYVD